MKNWGVDEEFRGSYVDDYDTLTNVQTATRDHYSVSVFRKDEKWRGKPMERFERRPLPDLVTWEESGKFHYLPFELRAHLLQGPWDELPELFLPSRVLDLAFRVFRKPEPALLKQVAFLAWVSDQEADNYFKESERLVQETLNDDVVKEKWVHHKLFTSNTKQELEAMCLAKRISFVGKKHELVAKLAEEKDADRDVSIYDGIISNVPSSVSQLNKQPVRYLRAVLSHHGILSVGTKEELIIRIGLLKCGQQQAVFSRERKALVELISMFKELLGVERKQNRQGLVTRKRANASNETSLMTTREAASAKKETICPPQKMESRSVTETLDFLEKKIVLEEKKMQSVYRKSFQASEKFGNVPSAKRARTADSFTRPRSQRNRKVPEKIKESFNNMASDFVAVGSKVKVLWTEKELKGTTFKPGWYEGEIQWYDEDMDTVGILYREDLKRGAMAVYELCLTLAMADGIVKF